MYIQADGEIIGIRNDDVLLIVKTNKNPQNVKIYKRDGTTIVGWMNEYSLLMYATFIADQTKWEKMTQNISWDN